MLMSTTQIPKKALHTTQLTFQQVQELAMQTRATWLTPVEALSREDAIVLSITTENLFPWLDPPPITQQTYRSPVVQRWVDRDQEDDSLPSLPASWKR